MARLIDSMLMEGRIVESSKTNLPPGVLLRVEGLCQKVGIKNANGRIYPKEVWEHVFNDNNWKQKIAEGAMVGEADHPESNVPSIQRASHVVREATWGGGEDIFATFDILDTPTGRILETLFNAGVKVGVSSRGDGSTRRDEDQGAEMVEVGYMPDTWDFVINPSTSGAYPTPIRESAQTPAYQWAVINAVEGTVNNNPSRQDLMECYSRIKDLHSNDPSITEAKNKLANRIYETLTNEKENGMENKNSGLQTPDNSVFLNEHVQRLVNESVKPLEEKIAEQNAMIVERDQKLTEQEKALEEREDWRKKYDELISGLGGADQVSEIKEKMSKFDAARSQVIPQLLEENERLNAELVSANELLEAHSVQSDTNRVAAYIESAIASFPDTVKPRLRAVLEGSKDVIEVDERLTNIEALMGEADMGAAPGGKGTPSDSGALPAEGNRDWMDRRGLQGTDRMDPNQPDPEDRPQSSPEGPPAPSSSRGVEGKGDQRQPHPNESRRRTGDVRRRMQEKRRREKERRNMTVAESTLRDRLPKPRSVPNPEQVVTENTSLNEDRSGGMASVIQNLASALGK